MPATMQQTTIHPINSLAPEQLTTTVTISLGAEPDSFQHDVTALTAAGPTGSQWIVTWNLAPSSELSVKFKDPGIINLSIPDGVKDPNLSGTPAQQQLTFINDVHDVNVIRYDLDLDVKDLTGKTLTHNIIFDPTITVVKDPIDG